MCTLTELLFHFLLELFDFVASLLRGTPFLKYKLFH